MNESTYYKFTSKTNPGECFYAYCNYPIASNGLLAALGTEEEYTVETEEYDISEGDTSNYWEETAANAIRPLHQLIAMAQIRPDGVWEGD